MAKKTKTNMVVGPTARYLTLDDLPDPKTKRWVPRRKAEVIHAVRGGLLTKEAAMKTYNLTNSEYAEWEAQYDTYGMSGLRVTHLQSYRT